MIRIKIIGGVVAGALFIVGNGIALVSSKHTPTNSQQTSSSNSPIASADQKTYQTPDLLKTGTSQTKSSGTTNNPTSSTPKPLTYTSTPSYTYTPSTTPSTYSSPSYASGSTRPDTSACFSEKQAALAPIRSQINQTIDKINNTPADIRGRTSGSLITEAQVQAMIAQALQPLNQQLSSQQAQYNQTASQYPC